MNPWVETKDGDPRVKAIFDRHYSRRRYKDGREPKLFVGPGQKMVLISSDEKAIFIWRLFQSKDQQQGINCAVFRNEGPQLSSELILQAEKMAATRWPGKRLYTYVDATKVKSRNPGYCFKIAEWKQCGVSKDRGLLIFEKFPPLPIGYVEIVRKRGRIAGYSQPPVPVDVLWAGTNRPRKKFGQRKDGFSFPPAVRELLLQQTAGHTVLHMFGGKADFGLRMDVDPLVKPDVVASCWYPPFARDSFDDVVLDPPYMQYRQQEKRTLLIRAAWIARRYVWWFGCTWIAADQSLKLQRGWLIRCGDQCAIRCLQLFAVGSKKRQPWESDLQRGEGLQMKYRNWRTEAAIPLPFDEVVTDFAPARNADLLAGQQIENRNKIFLGDW